MYISRGSANFISISHDSAKCCVSTTMVEPSNICLPAMVAQSTEYLPGLIEPNVVYLPAMVEPRDVYLQKVTLLLFTYQPQQRQVITRLHQEKICYGTLTTLS